MKPETPSKVLPDHAKSFSIQPLKINKDFDWSGDNDQIHLNSDDIVLKET